MIRVHKLADMGEAGLSHLLEWVGTPSDDPLATNRRKNQWVSQTAAEGKSLIVKTYIHRALKHRLASFCGHSNADRYSSIACFLKNKGLSVPQPILVVKSGPGLLPEKTLYTMEHVQGRMLFNILAELEEDPPRVKRVAERVCRLILGLRQAGVIHRDLNTKNFLVSDQDEVTLIDLDAATRHRIRGSRFVRRHQRDVHTFLSTCHGAPQFAAAVASQLE